MINLLAVGSALAMAGTSAAADTLLAKTALQLDKGSVTAELWGDRLPSGYSEDLLVLLKDERGKLVTAYAPSIKGGYYPILEAVQVKPVDKKAATDAGSESVSEAKQAAQQLRDVLRASRVLAWELLPFPPRRVYRSPPGELCYH